MREIKFRGKAIEGGEWFYGHYYHEAGCMPNPIRVPGSPPPDPGHHWIVFPGPADWNTPRQMQQVEVDPNTVGQFTGLRAKNREEVYEGDIVRRFIYSSYAKSWVEDLVSKVRWLEGEGRFVISIPDLIIGFDDFEAAHCEVVGNIWDNPELLKGEG